MSPLATSSIPRSDLGVMLSVWHALFLREALTRLTTGRAAWFWLLMEPVFHVAAMMVIFTTIRIRHIGGIDTAPWLMTGLLVFFMFRRTATQAMNAISANQALFTYRQVKPVDTVLVRSGLEGLLMVLISAVVWGGAAFIGLSVTPADPLTVLSSFAGMWFIGLGFGLTVSVLVELVPEGDRLVRLVMLPLYFASGVIFPLSLIPPPYIDWLMWNPLAHATEAVRMGLAPYYHAVPGVSLGYLHACALVLVFFGLALHRRFALNLVIR
jgi:capsular polysaccharide transport system permease protein